MKRSELNWFTLAILKAIKKLCTEEEYLEYYKPTEFISIEKSERKNSVNLTHYKVKTKIHELYECKIAVWDVCIYSHGECSIYLDGIE